MKPESRNTGDKRDVYSRQQLGKQVSVATDTQATREKLLGTMFSIRSVQIGYKEEFN
jgi:hypothetical protein